MTRARTIACFAAALGGGIAHGIECDELEVVAFKLMQDHYVHRQFDDALSQRILNQTLKTIDPGKLFFLKKDVEAFQERYGRDIDLWMFAQSCGFLEAIRETYYHRSNERHSSVQAFIQEDHDFSVAEDYHRFDRRDYLEGSKELEDRWRRQIKYQILQSRLTGLEDTTIRDKLARHYQKTLINEDRLTATAIRDKFLIALARAMDPHTKYYPPANANDLRIALGGSFFGIGATIESRNESFFISRLNPGGPAFLSQAIQLGDQILAISSETGEPIEAFGKTITELVHLIRGPKDTKVELTIHRQTPEGPVVKKVPIIRDRIDPVAAAATMKMFQVSSEIDSDQPLQIGVISLTSFYLDSNAQRNHEPDYRSATKDVHRLLTALNDAGIDSLILDLRGNGGGILSEAIGVTGLFIPSGPVVQKRDAVGEVVILEDKNPKVSFSGPLTVIIEPQAASASEIVAGALQDYRRALIVGTGKTFGKGTVQIVASVDRRNPQLGSYKLTNALYFLPRGRTPQLDGIVPDIQIHINNPAHFRMEDYPFAIPTETMDPAEFTPSAKGNHHRVILQTRSQSRLKPSQPAPSVPAPPRDRVSLKQSDHASSPNAFKKVSASDSDPVLEESLRITYDRHHLLRHYPLRNTPIDITTP